MYVLKQCQGKAVAQQQPPHRVERRRDSVAPRKSQKSMKRSEKEGIRLVRDGGCGGIKLNICGCDGAAALRGIAASAFAAGRMHEAPRLPSITMGYNS